MMILATNCDAKSHTILHFGEKNRYIDRIKFLMKDIYY